MEMADGHQVQPELRDKPAGAPTSLEFTKAQSPSNNHSGSGSRQLSTPGSTGKSPLKDGAYWFAGAGEDQGELVDSYDYRSSDSYWFAHAAEGDQVFPNLGSGDCADPDGKEFSFSQKDREERLRLLRERQSEERQKRVDELKQAAIHAQRVREQQEDERRRKIDELRYRDHERRTLVEERKKQIWEAERERREFILRKNSEREARIEAKRNANRSSIGFAFGSSTPRIYESETGGGYFGNRRAASQSNVTCPVTNGSRHSVDREIDPHKKRATSAFSLDNKSEKQYNSAYEAFHWSDVSSPTYSEDSLNEFQIRSSVVDSVPPPPPPPPVPTFSRADRFAGNFIGSGCFVGEDLMTRSCSALGAPPVRGRRKTDLIPTIPVHDSPRTQSPATRTTPSSPSRPNSSLSQQSLSSHASQNSAVSMRNRNPARRSARPLSIAGTTPDVTVKADERQGRSTERKLANTGKSPRAKSVGAENVLADNGLTVAKPPPAARKPSNVTKTAPSATPRPATAPSNAQKEAPKDKPKIAPKPSAKMITKPSPKQSPTVEQIPPIPAQVAKITPAEPISTIESKPTPPPVEEKQTKAKPAESEINDVDKPAAVVEAVPTREETPPPTDPMTTSMGKPRITTEDEAKAALAERRRIAREQAEREAELERQRQEELKRQEEERIRLEEEERQRWEKEQDQLRKIEEDRVKKAIEEQEQKEEEERKKREEEAKNKAEREEQEKKAREEQLRIWRETEEKLRKEEEERVERRKRVEAIMSRTRNKGGAGGTPVTTPTKAHADLPGSKSDESNNETDKGIPHGMQSSLIMESIPTAEQVELMSTSMPSLPSSQPDLLGDIPAGNDVIENGKNSANESMSVHANGLTEKVFTPEANHLDMKVADNVDDFGEIVNQKLPPTTDFEQLIDLSVCPSTTATPFAKKDDFLNNADNVNSNIPSSNGPTAPFIAFEDNFTKKQETNMTDLLS